MTQLTTNQIQKNKNSGQIKKNKKLSTRKHQQKHSNQNSSTVQDESKAQMHQRHRDERTQDGGSVIAILT